MQVSANGAAFNLEDSGTGDHALVFLHYFGGAARSWAAVVPLLVDTYRCIVPDLRGFGDSDATLDDGYSVSAAADDLAALIGALELTRYTLVGHSMGGKIALAFAARRPPGLQSLVLLAPSPPTPEPMEDAERARMLAGYGDRAAAEETVRKGISRPLPPDVHAQAVADNLRTSHIAWRWWLERGSKEDISETIEGNVAVPVHILAGGDDMAMTASLLEREIAQRVGRASLTTLPGVAHLVPLEAPAEAARFICGERAGG